MARARRRTEDYEAAATEVSARLATWKKSRSGDARRVCEQITALLTQRARIQHDLGRLLAEAQDGGLYRGLEGVTSFGQFVESLGLGRSQAYKLIAVARDVSVGDAAKLGTERAYERARKVSRRKKRKA